MSGTIFSICIILSLVCCSQNFISASCPKTMGKRMQEEKGEERIVAKSCRRWTWLRMLRQVLRLCKVEKSGDTQGTVSTWLAEHRETCSERTQSRHSVEFSSVKKDAMLDESTRRLVAAEVNQELLNFHGNLKSTRKLVATGNPDIDGTDRIWPHNLHISTAYVPHIEKVFSNVRQRYGLSPGDINGKSRCECGYMGNSYVRHSSSCSWSWTKLFENLRSTRNQSMRSLKQLIQVTGKLITDQTEITSIPVIYWQQQMWQRTTLLADKAVQFATAQTYVFSDSVLWLGGISSDPVRAWKDKINLFMESHQFREWSRIDVEPMEFEWNIFTGFTTLGILAEIQKMMTEIKCQPEHFQGRIIFLSMYNDIE